MRYVAEEAKPAKELRPSGRHPDLSALSGRTSRPARPPTASGSPRTRPRRHRAGNVHGGAALSKLSARHRRRRRDPGPERPSRRASSDAASHQAPADKTAAVLKSTGNAAGTTVPHVQEPQAPRSPVGRRRRTDHQLRTCWRRSASVSRPRLLRVAAGGVSHDELATGDEIRVRPRPGRGVLERIDSMHRFRIKVT